VLPTRRLAERMATNHEVGVSNLSGGLAKSDESGHQKAILPLANPTDWYAGRDRGAASFIAGPKSTKATAPSLRHYRFLVLAWSHESTDGSHVVTCLVRRFNRGLSEG